MGNTDWYIRHLRGDPPLTPLAPLAPMPAPMEYRQQAVVPPSPPPAPGCPECGSTNYGKPGPSHSPRCFECGYGLSIKNSTQGLPAPNNGVATPAMQVPTAGYQPTNIIGRVN